MFIIEQPIPPAPAADSAVNVLAEWNAVYDAYNEVACLILKSMTPELYRQFENYSPYEILQELKSMFEKQAGVERVGLILNGLTSDFASFVRNYNMHNMGKTIGEIHALLIEYEKGLPKKAATPQVMAIQSENPSKNDACHHCKEVGHWKRNCHVYLAELMENKKQVGTASSSVSNNDILYFNAIPRNGVYEIDMSNLVPNVNSIYNLVELSSSLLLHIHHNTIRVSERRNRTLLDMVRSMVNLTTLSLSFWDYALESAARILNMVPTKKVDKTPYELWYGKVPNLSYLKVWGCEALVKRDTPDKLQQRSVKCIFIGYPKETMGYYFYFPPENKIVVARYAEFFEKNLLSQEVSGRAGELEEIQDEDTSPSENTSEIPMEVEGFEPPQEEVIPVRRSVRTHRAPERLCLNVEVEEHSLGDFNKPVNYKATMLDPKSNKWFDAMNAEMQSMKDNQVWCLVDLPPNGKIVGNKWIFKKKTDMDDIVHTYKARLAAKGFTQTFGVDYKKRSHPLLTLELLGFL
ncbi:retrotransposon protein, putative, ty1-copia subclass [Tanacetum coccineum]|uniref:Retrotransposon protein, putative, ty1-copia subclass n=1 Tax=Tanacetum coccineum TaxID=301880 RepID=A0ABQ4WD19_9ASTR